MFLLINFEFLSSLKVLRYWLLTYPMTHFMLWKINFEVHKYNTDSPRAMFLRIWGKVFYWSLTFIVIFSEKKKKIFNFQVDFLKAKRVFSPENFVNCHHISTNVRQRLNWKNDVLRPHTPKIDTEEFLNRWKWNLIVLLVITDTILKTHLSRETLVTNCSLTQYTDCLSVKPILQKG